MNLIEFSVSLLAPHTCLICKKEGPPACMPCSQARLKPSSACCYRCGASSHGFKTCQACRPHTPLAQVFGTANYEGLAKDVVALLKFQRVKASAEVVSGWLDLRLPGLPNDIIVSPVPTANKRIRKRGYDQARLIARGFAKKRKLEYRETLRRARSTRQVGSGRQERFSQLSDAFRVHKPGALAGKHILLIDDVLTTGATLESAAKALKAQGVAKIDGAVFARQPLGGAKSLANSSSTKSDSKSGR